ncbi:MAG TPA: PSD1 and planctomycete cytochrome C domain-containing protein [Bryobacteraceae bacterium]|jgi:mono/diheme cytochrome c family protein|nr:PSD1 and planctomycete cytochrome C domain-containing protein [Bryobacteraceae bacterium]
MRKRALALSITIFAAFVFAPRMLAKGGARTPEVNATVTFADVQPIFQKNCYACHGSAAVSGLRLDSYEAILKGGNSGPAVSPGNPDKSLLIVAVRQTDPDLKMPKGGKLKADEIAILENWVKSGAPGPVAAKADVTNANTKGAVPIASQAADFFETRVRPILVANCYGCHTNAAMSGLRVDSLQGLLKGGNSGPAIVPGDADKSLLIQAVRQSGDLKMPKGGKLKPEEVIVLEDWVKMGAPWPNSAAAPTIATGPTISGKDKAFWSFQPLHKPPVPPVQDKKWPTTTIDRFVLAKLESEGLTPVAQADKRSLIRRATYDLTGLPPTHEEIEAFEKDKSPRAYEAVLDRLLASPRYGERWGRHWLDVVRYGEDDVRGLDPMGRGFMPWSGASYYRDWVIKAFNDDMPFDTFIKAQLAGDLMDAKVRPTYLPGTAMLGQGPWIWDQAEPIQGRADERNERVDMVSRGLLGLTVACARCHNHKYDPILQKDYYALVGVFASTTYNEYPVGSEAKILAWQRKQDVVTALQKELREFTHTESEQLSDILAHQAAKYMVAAWRVSGEPHLIIEEASTRDKVDPELLERWVKYLEKPKKQYPFLKDWQAMVATGGTEDEAKTLAADYQALILNVLADSKKIKKQNDIIKAKADVPERLDRDAKPNEFETDDQFCPGCNLELKTLPTEKANLWVDLFVRSLESSEDKPKPGLLVFTGWGLTRRLSPVYQDHIAELNAQIKTLQKEAEKLEYPFIHGVTDKPKAVNVALNLRGNPHNLGDEVPRRFLEVLSPAAPTPFAQGSGRMQLAGDIVQSGLAMRVFVNRVWKWHFGTGIVNTPDNFGKAGDPPSSPQLLEYLANSFVDNGMSLKKLQKEIMLSTVYRLASMPSKENEEKDPANRYYWRFNKQRLDAEEVRDSVLFASGKLDLKNVGGPSTDFSDDNTRRTVYCKISRFRMNNFLQVFDFPNPSFTAEQRFSTIVPLQRLYFMNSGFVYQNAGELARRVYGAGDDAARIRDVYLLLFGRLPTEKEMQLGLGFLHTTPDLKGETITGQPPTAWKEYARVLLSSNEFEFVE